MSGATPRGRFGDRADDARGRPFGALDDHDVNAKITRGIQLGHGMRAAGVLTEQHIDSVIDENPVFAGVRIRSSRRHDRPARRDRRGGRIDQADQHVAISPRCEAWQGLPSGGQKRPAGEICRGSGCVGVGDPRPAARAGVLAPAGAL